MHMKAHLRLLISLFAVVIGFGSQWNCTIQIGPPEAPEKKAPAPAPAPAPVSGCVNQQPTYTLGEEAPHPSEYAIVVGKFKPEQKAEAHRLSAELRAKRVFNSVWIKTADGTIMVTVGRYGTKKQAEDKLKAVRDRGYPEACVDQPSSAADFAVANAECPDCEPKPKPEPEWPPILIMFTIIVIVVLVVAYSTNTTKKKC